ncbi:MAG: hypothetical protein MZV63_60420 [Marinilabiliales bacterium]|nr:hypothetical protein [Marinilabiliales bacterium]
MPMHERDRLRGAGVKAGAVPDAMRSVDRCGLPVADAQDVLLGAGGDAGSGLRCRLFCIHYRVKGDRLKQAFLFCDERSSLPSLFRPPPLLPQVDEIRWPCKLRKTSE